MKAKDIEVGAEYAVGRPHNGRWHSFDELWPGRRMRVVAKGVRGKVRGPWHSKTSSRATYVEVVPLDGQVMRWEYECPLDRYGHIMTRSGAKDPSVERVVYRVPYRDVLAPWDQYVADREVARRQAAEAEARDVARRKERMIRHEDQRKRLATLGVIDADAPTMLGGVMPVKLSDSELEHLISLAERASMRCDRSER